MMKKKIMTQAGVLFFVSAMMGGLSSNSVMANSLIIKNGRPQAEIIIAENPPRAVKLAAAELQQYLEKISGAKLLVTNLVDRAIPVKIYVGKSRYTDELKVSDEGLSLRSKKIS